MKPDSMDSSIDISPAFPRYASPPPFVLHIHKNTHSHFPVQTIGHYSPEPHFSPPLELLHRLHDRRLRRYLWARFSLAVGYRTVASFSKHILVFRLWVGNLLSWAQVKKSLCHGVAHVLEDFASLVNEKELVSLLDETNPSDPMAKKSPEDRVKELEAENKQLQKALELEKLRSKAYGTMIDVAEETFNIPIRKKSGTKQ